MNGSEPIVRVAAKGDGVTADGRHVAGAAPGDLILGDGSVGAGPHHATPPCRHFGECGACQLQHLDLETLAEFVSDRVVNAARGQDLAAGIVAPAHLSPPRSRRRATLHAARASGRVVIGFKAAGSHRIVDLAECHVLLPELFAIVSPLRTLLARGPRRLAAEVSLVASDQGVDLAIKGIPLEGLGETEAMLDFARTHRLARLTLDQGYGAEPLWEPEPVTVTIGSVPVAYPPGAFLQATLDGERALIAAAQDWFTDASTVADLFAGLGTFTFALGKRTRVLAAEAARDAHLACKTAAARAQRPIEAVHRDLFRNPLLPDELDRFDAVLLDPPRAGAREQVMRLAQSRVPRLVYVSCNPASWARDAAILVAGGWQLSEVRPIGQFRWSTHVELASLFIRG